MRGKARLLVSSIGSSWRWRRLNAELLLPLPPIPLLLSSLVSFLLLPLPVRHPRLLLLLFRRALGRQEADCRAAHQQRQQQEGEEAFQSSSLTSLESRQCKRSPPFLLLLPNVFVFFSLSVFPDSFFLLFSLLRNSAFSSRFSMAPPSLLFVSPHDSHSLRASGCCMYTPW